MVSTPNVRHSAMAEIARQLAERDSSEDELMAVATVSAVDRIAGAESCGITLVSKDGVRSVAPTDADTALLDELQTAANNGPCLQAASEWSTHIVRVDDYDNETRWPAYITAARDRTQVRSTMSFQLYRSTDTMGALNVHSTRPHAFSAEAEEIGLAIATHAAMAMHSARRQTQFASALASRDIIGQAKGMIMHQFKIDALQAWELLRKLSQNENIPVSALAQKLIDTEINAPTAAHSSASTTG